MQTLIVPTNRQEVDQILANREREHLALVSPRELSAAEKQIEAARAQLAKAEQGLAERKAVISDLEQRIVALGEHRALVVAFADEFAFEPAQNVALKLFSLWESSIQNPCPQSVSKYHAARAYAAEQSALREHVAGRLQELKSKEKTMIDDILALAKNERIDLGNLLAVMKTESGKQPSGRLGNERRWQLFAAGRLNDLTKN